MGLLASNGATIGMILKFLGIRDLRASTEHPDASVQFDFVRHGVKNTRIITLQELTDSISKASPQDATGPSGDYIDISDLPDG